MKFYHRAAGVFIPDGRHLPEALSRTTHLAVGAHQDDLEMMAVDGILTCFRDPDQWFSGVVVTDGSGSPRNGKYAGFSDDEMARVRVEEQKKAALIGEYSAQVFLAYPSAAVKDHANQEVVADLVRVLKSTRPKVVYTHDLADMHITHVAVGLRVLQAIRQLPLQERPEKVYGCEGWRGLDWMLDEDKIAFDCSGQENLQAALLGVFDSQITGGKRYDLAVSGRRRANATFYSPYQPDREDGLCYAMDLTPLVENDSLSIREYVSGFMARFRREVLENLEHLES